MLFTFSLSAAREHRPQKQHTARHGVQVRCHGAVATGLGRRIMPTPVITNGSAFSTELQPNPPQPCYNYIYIFKYIYTSIYLYYVYIYLYTYILLTLLWLRYSLLYGLGWRGRSHVFFFLFGFLRLSIVSHETAKGISWNQNQNIRNFFYQYLPRITCEELWELNTCTDTDIFSPNVIDVQRNTT